MLMKSAQILKKVIADYTSIAKEFDSTRNQSWPEFEDFLKIIKPSKGVKIKLLDAGCGNGRLLDFFNEKSIKNIDYTGIDNNRVLLKIARGKHPKAEFKKAAFKYGDILSLPLPARSFDCVWCIAVLHHIPGTRLQLKALKILKKILKKNGVLMLTVWNLWQPKYKKYICARMHEALIPWGGNKKTKRFYYAFKQAELAALLKKAGFKNFKKIGNNPNIAFVCYEKN